MTDQRARITPALVRPEETARVPETVAPSISDRFVDRVRRLVDRLRCLVDTVFEG